MGAYASFKIGKFEFLYTENSYAPIIKGVFNKADFYIEDQNIDGEVYKKYVFKTDVENFKTCLDLMGYTVKKAQQDFEKSFFDAIDISFPKTIRNDEERQHNYLKRNFSFKRWVKHVVFFAKWLIENDEYDDSHQSKLNMFNAKNVCEKCVLDSLTEWYQYSYFGMNYDYYDCINTIRIILEYLEDDVEVIYDVSELINEGWVSLEDFQAIEEQPIKKTIVLVEGTTDKQIIELALNKIYPHYNKFFYIMDFDNPKRPGSATEITRIIKAFMCSHIDNNFIALYDNDVAGRKEVELSFKDIKIPENIKILSYPNLKFAKSYPTLGTNGKIVKDNINGRASSIELYLPNFMLTDTSDAFNYIIWKSLDDKMKDYQGEINNKGQIFRKFLDYKKQLEENEISFNVTEWEKMKQLIDSFLFAFIR